MTKHEQNYVSAYSHCAELQTTIGSSNDTRQQLSQFYVVCFTVQCRRMEQSVIVNNSIGRGAQPRLLGFVQTFMAQLLLVFHDTCFLFVS